MVRAKQSSKMMSSRDSILASVLANQPGKTRLPDLHSFERHAAGSIDKFVTTLKAVGGHVYYVSSYAEIINILQFINDKGQKIISPVKELGAYYNQDILNSSQVDDLHDIDTFIINAQFAVAENGAVWVTDKEMHQRVLPFICQHLCVIVNGESIVPTMHEAYDVIAQTTYGFGTFIAGPSKTADIEQSLVIGAHGPRSMTAFIMHNE
jgi:L-lactate dehydrogenase complex protein LldG